MVLFRKLTINQQIKKKTFIKIINYENENTI